MLSKYINTVHNQNTKNKFKFNTTQPQKTLFRFYIGINMILYLNKIQFNNKLDVKSLTLIINKIVMLIKNTINKKNIELNISQKNKRFYTIYLNTKTYTNAWKRYKNKRVRILFTKWKMFKQIYRHSVHNKRQNYRLNNQYTHINKTLSYKTYKSTNIFNKKYNYTKSNEITTTFKKDFAHKINENNTTFFKKYNKLNETVFKFILIYSELFNNNKLRILKKLKRTAKLKLGKIYKNKKKFLHVLNNSESSPIYSKNVCNFDFKKYPYKAIYLESLKTKKNIINYTNVLNNKYINKHKTKVSFYKNLLLITRLKSPLINWQLTPTNTMNIGFFKRKYSSSVSKFKDQTLNNTNDSWSLFQKHKKINNYTPLTQYKSLLQNSPVKYNTTISNFKKTQSFQLHLNFIIMFLENYLKTKVWLRINNKKQINSFWKNYIHNFINFYRHSVRKHNRLINVNQLIEILIYVMKFKDVQIFLFFVKTCIESTHFKNHKKILNTIFDVIYKNKTLLNLTTTKGFSFDIRGKVGVSGNAKKRHIFFSIGKTSTTSQNLKAQWQQINVWTPTGQMGITCLIQF